MRAVHYCLPLYSKEQLPIGYEDLLTTKPRGLEDIPQLSWTIASSTLDYRSHSPTEWLWRLHKVPDEVHNRTAGHLEDVRQLPVVAPQLKVQ
jgi:hypothetical protein